MDFSTRKKLHYVTVFPECCSIHLKKDVGMLPYSLEKYQGYQSAIICYDNGDISPEEQKKYHVTFICKTKGEHRDFGTYLLRHARQIDVLNLYHITSRRNLPWILMYKLGNPKGKVHIKLDADMRMVELVDMHPTGLKGKLKSWILRNLVDLYTVETTQMQQVLENAWGLPMELMPNGLFLDDENHLQGFPEAQNVFLTVGRLGTEQKATEILLEAYRLIADQTDWQLWLAGPVEPDFEAHIQAFFENNPDLTTRVKFLGNIADPKQLAEIYGQAKVFVLPSRWEGSPLVLPEALERGEYLVVSEQVPSVSDVGANGKYCSVVPADNIQALADAMLKSVNIPCDDQIRKERSEWVLDNFTWEQIVKTLDSYLHK